MLTRRDIDRVIEMAWEDRTPFEAIQIQFGLSEKDVIVIMRRELKKGSWKKWRARVQNRKTKHRALSSTGLRRFKSKAQRVISSNKLSKQV